MRHGQHFCFIGEKVAVIGTSPVIEDGYLTFEGADGAIYIDFSPFHTDVINEVAGSEIITSVYNDNVGADDFIRILFSQSCGIGIDLHIMVQGFETFLGLDGFGHTYLGFTIKYLTLQVADTYHIIVY